MELFYHSPIIETLTAALGGIYSPELLALRATCREARKALSAPPHKRANVLLYEAAMAGDAARCNHAIAAGASGFSFMIAYAGRSGHMHICEMAHALGANPGHMLVFGAEGNQRAICERAIEWGANNLEEAFSAAARGGCLDICKMLHQIAATRGVRFGFQHAIYAAIKNDRPEIVRFIGLLRPAALNLGVNFATSLRKPAYVSLLRECGATN